MEKPSIYDTPIFFERYKQLRQNPISLNEIVEKPTMFSLLPDPQGKRILDLGCGMGEHLHYYLQNGASFVAGLDLSQAMLAQARENLAKDWQEQTAFRLYCGEMERLDQLEEMQFELVTSSFAFHYVADFPALLQQISQKLTPKGELIFSQEHPIVTAHQQGERWEKDQHRQQVAYRLNYYRQEGERERNWFKQPFKTYHRTIATIFNDLIDANFEIIRVEEPMLADCPEWHNEFKDLLHRPPLLFVRARKKAH